MALLLMGSNCARTVNDCPEGTAIPNVNFDSGSRECLPFDEICFTEDRGSTIACVDCPTCDPYEHNDGGVPDASIDGEVPECESDTDCSEIDAARCDTETGTCVGCDQDLSCIGVDAFERCDADEGLCVECKPISEELDCGATSCNPATFECTDTERGSRIVCESCVSDSDCGPDLGCVPMTFGETPRTGGYCLQRVGTEPCAQPFAFPLAETRESLSGAAPALYCGVKEDLTTCEAVWDLVNNETCEDDIDCPAPGGFCRPVGALGLRCTYECTVPSQCLDPDDGSGSTCGDNGGTAEEKYCGG
ncbi:MAG: hypothetical protein HKN10_06705 [Myxococcales bacterium]|nr:hypothetical protein [Myxococcales bacterium]